LQVRHQVLLRLFFWMSLVVMQVLQGAGAVHLRKVRQVLREGALVVCLPLEAVSLQGQRMAN
jgi:hypothetical protein